jgi:hypothetical protein
LPGNDRLGFAEKNQKTRKPEPEPEPENLQAEICRGDVGQKYLEF